MDYNELKKTYNKLTKIAETDGLRVDMHTLKRNIDKHLKQKKIFEETGVDIDKLSMHCRFTIWTENHRVSCSDNNKQPNVGDRFLVFSFPTGAYIFGNYYPRELFHEFFKELKTFKPEFCDSINHCLYFNMKNAEEIYKSFPLVLGKYAKKSTNLYKEYKKEKLKKELEALN